PARPSADPRATAARVAASRARRQGVSVQRVQDRADEARGGARAVRAASANMSTLLGVPVTRVDGKAKVTGTAQYAAELGLPNLAYAALVLSTSPKASSSESTPALGVWIAGCACSHHARQRAGAP